MMDFLRALQDSRKRASACSPLAVVQNRGIGFGGRRSGTPFPGDRLGSSSSDCELDRPIDVASDNDEGSASKRSCHERLGRPPVVPPPASTQRLGSSSWGFAAAAAELQSASACSAEVRVALQQPLASACCRRRRDARRSPRAARRPTQRTPAVHRCLRRPLPCRAWTAPAS